MSSLSSGARSLPGRARGGAAFNTVVSCILVAIFIVVFMSYCWKALLLARETALQSELRNIRTAVQLFVVLNRRLPASLEELVEKKILLPDQEFRIPATGGEYDLRTPFTRSYLEPRSLDGEGRVLDPFGKPYRYDPRRGLVSPGEERYSGW